MGRIKLINNAIKTYKYKSYLEIGTQLDNCLSQVNCDFKVGVDPNGEYHKEENSDLFFEIDSDEFFSLNEESFDIIFIDGLHHSEQVIKDINNSLLILNEGGMIVVHDCNPLSYEAQIIPETHLPTWNGDVWKAWMHFRINRSDLIMLVWDVDQGCGIIMNGVQDMVTPDCEVNYENLEKNRRQWLNLIDYEDI